MQQALTSNLRKKLSNAERVGILGIGSELRGDDIAGISVARQMEKLIKSKPVSAEVKFFIGETAPENLTGEIKQFQPSHLVIIDSVYFEAKPGEIILMEPRELGDVSFFTHKLPLKLMIDYLLQFFKCEVLIIGIQPKNIDFDSPVSKEVSSAVRMLSKTIAEILLQKSK